MPNIRYGGIVAAGNAPPAGIVPLTKIPLATVAADDATVFPAPRTAFLRAWIGSPGHVGCALMRDGALAGWGVIRPCLQGRKIGPLVADDRAAAEAILSALLASAGGGEIFLDVPSINRDAIALAQGLGLAPVFETARMYTGAITPLRLERIFGVTTFELPDFCPRRAAHLSLIEERPPSKVRKVSAEARVPRRFPQPA